jgi:hypothetical protein
MLGALNFDPCELCGTVIAWHPVGLELLAGVFNHIADAIPRA